MLNVTMCNTFDIPSVMNEGITGGISQMQLTERIVIIFYYCSSITFFNI